jgi:hypothetical protein
MILENHCYLKPPGQFNYQHYFNQKLEEMPKHYNPIEQDEDLYEADYHLV